MKNLIFIFLLLTSNSVLALNLNQSDLLFDWAEIQYPDLFSPSNRPTQIHGEWYYRYYQGTNNYLGVTANGDVHVKGDSFGGLKRIDKLSSLLRQVDQSKVNRELNSPIASNNLSWELFTARELIQAMLMSEDGKKLWVGSLGGLEEYDAKTGKLVKKHTTLDGLARIDVEVLETDSKGGLWAGLSLWNLSYRDAKGQWTKVSAESAGIHDERIRDLVSDETGGLWILPFHNNSLIYRSANGHWIEYTSDNSTIPDKLITAITKDANGGLWAFMNGDLVFRSVMGQWTVYNMDELVGRWHGLSPTLESDPNGGVWVDYSVFAPGLMFFNTDGELKVLTKENSGIPDTFSYFDSIASDSQGGLWVQPRYWNGELNVNNGLAHLNADGKWTIYTAENSILPSHTQFTIESDHDGGLWVSTNELLIYRSPQGEWNDYSNKGELYRLNIAALKSDNNNGLWIGSYDHLAYRNNNDGKLTSYTPNNSDLPEGIISKIAIDTNGGVWLFYGLGIVKLNTNGSWEIFAPDNSVLSSNRIKAMASDDRGGIWIGTERADLVGENLVYHNNGKWKVYTSPYFGLSEHNYRHTINTLKSDNNDGVWVGTNSGMAHLNSKGDWIIYTTENSGLPDNKIAIIEGDNNGGVWIGGKNGFLAHRTSEGKWTVHINDQSNIHISRIKSLKPDNSGGLWITYYLPREKDADFYSTPKEGLLYRSSTGQWSFIDIPNSTYPFYWGLMIENDVHGGLWLVLGYLGLMQLKIN